MKYSITLQLPPKECSPNHHGHWAKQRRESTSYRTHCYWAYMQLICANRLPSQLTTPVTIHLDFYLCRKDDVFGDWYFPRDADNARAAFKSGQDALKDARLIPDDSAKYVKVGETRLHTRARDHQGRAMLVVTLEEQ